MAEEVSQCGERHKIAIAHRETSHRVVRLLKLLDGSLSNNDVQDFVRCQRVPRGRRQIHNHRKAKLSKHLREFVGIDYGAGLQCLGIEAIDSVGPTKVLYVCETIAFSCGANLCIRQRSDFLSSKSVDEFLNEP